jgi:hypothetical protein
MISSAAPQARRTSAAHDWSRSGFSGMAMLLAITLLATSLFHVYASDDSQPDIVTYAFRV